MKKLIRKAALIAGVLLLGTCTIQKTDTVQAAQVRQIKDGFGSENGHTVYWKNGKKIRSQFLTIGSDTWYFDGNGYMVTGYQKIEGKSYYFRREGSEHYGAMIKSRFMKLGNNTLYFCKTGDAIVDKVVNINGKYFGFNERGYRQTNMFRDYNGGTYYLGSDGRAYTSGVYEINGKRYGFASNGRCYKNVVKTVGKNTYYFNAKGEAERGLRSYNGDRYYICKDYTLLKSKWKVINGKTFYFLKTGKAAKGVVIIGGKKYLFQSSGIRISGPGFKTLDSQKYLLDSNSAVLTGWQNYCGETYYFSSNGTMVVSRFMTRNGKKCYLTSKGTLAKGWVVLGEDRYYFLKDGSMATNRVLGSDYVGFDGKSACYQMLAAINDEREKAGVAPLKMNKYLLSAAAVRSPEITIVFDHVRPNGQMCFTAVSPAYVGTLGENIACAPSPLPLIDNIVNMWMNSPGHRENILRSEFKGTGIGLSYKNGVWYWVQMFGSVR